MNRTHWDSRLGSAALLLLLTFGGTSGALADPGDPPTRIARMAYVEGAVSLQPGGTDDWVSAPLNRPLTTGDAIWSDVNSRAELQLDGSLLRLAGRTQVSFLNLDDNVTQLQLTAGTLIVRVRGLDDGETYEIDTPNLALTLRQPGLYRVAVDDSGSVTTVAVRRGEAQVTGGGADYAVESGQQIAFAGTDTLTADAEPYGQSPFDVWSAGRDDRWDHAVSAQYVSPDVVGFADLDDQGDWTSTPDYGYVWFPRVQPGWAPYHFGHWAYIAPWGYTWVDDRPWGFAPFHYGRWIWLRGAWGWVPCPPRPPGGVAYVRPVYAPALVAWVGGGGAVAWFALGPRDVYVPSYPVSRHYVDDINVSNTVVNRSVVNNVYDTTVVNHRTVNITYVNRGVPGAVAATSTQAFTSAQPVATHPVQFNGRAGPVQSLAPAVAPTHQAVLGAGRLNAARPPTALLTRAVVAHTPPPPPRPTQRRSPVRFAPPARVAAPQVSAAAPRPAARAPVVPAPAPPTPNLALERQQQQAALQRQQAEQQAEQQLAAQQQERDRQERSRQQHQAEQQQAEQQRQQQQAQLHQQQLQAQQQAQLQAQQQAEQQQAEQQRQRAELQRQEQLKQQQQNAPKPTPKPSKPEHPPDPEH